MFHVKQVQSDKIFDNNVSHETFKNMDIRKLMKNKLFHMKQRI